MTRRLWHPFADMGAVRHAELVIERGEDVWVWDSDGHALPRRDREPLVRERRPRPSARSPRRSPRRWRSSRRTRRSATSPAGRRSSSPRCWPTARRCPRACSSARAAATRSTRPPSSRAATGTSSAQPDRTVLISRTAGYHGTHGFGTAIGGIAANRDGFGPLVETVQVAARLRRRDARRDRRARRRAGRGRVRRAGDRRRRRVSRRPTGYIEGGRGALCRRPACCS